MVFQSVATRVAMLENGWVRVKQKSNYIRKWIQEHLYETKDVIPNIIATDKAKLKLNLTEIGQLLHLFYSFIWFWSLLSTA